ncbi:MAG TPA: 16S rRNA (cytidine(1402)-2'-O)-methyltransferase [Candidatus Doudnabacteria bacterium]|nr:16S rRNA (cytidine(1402)-2'-O)-methyltransferase [Candidatus Doudnabacteria bacterium]
MLYIVPTPLGNLEDMTARAKNQLSACDFIIAENPSQTHKLLQLLGLPKKEVKQFADHNEQKVIDQLLERIKTETACLVSDAGTPGISDPGFRLVRAARKEKIEVFSLPGASAAVTALAGSGLPTDKFLFIGFFPKTEPKLIRVIEEAKQISATLIAYESPQRLLKTLGYIAKTFPDANIVVARELTKMHEEYQIGSANELMKIFKAKPAIKGEITILVSLK